MSLAPSNPTHGVIPAQAGIHAEGHPGAGWVRVATDLDSGLRRNDAVDD